MTIPIVGVVAAELIQDLIALGYLVQRDGNNHARVTRAITRFQRHAARPYRMPGPDVAPTFVQAANGICDEATAAEIRLWIQKKWRLPLGRFHINSLNNIGTKPIRLRQDAATAWGSIVHLATNKGATLGGEYGDSTRGVHPTAKIGASHHSFHYCGRAVDISQDFTKSKDHRYYIVKEPKGPDARVGPS